MQQNTWFTPEGIEDLLPEQAKKLEHYRRQLLDGFESSGYDLVLPPIAEFTDSLLTGTGSHLAVDTCRFTDQESGRMMGVRADMTPQVARIVANRLKGSDQILRLCYVGEVLKTRNNKAKGSRSPIQVGAELFGHQGVESDIEVIALMLSSIRALGLNELTLSLGHVSIVEELMALAGFKKSQTAQLVDILLRKAVPEYQAFVAENTIPESLKTAFDGLLSLCGDVDQVLEKSQKILGGISTKIDEHLERLTQIVRYFEVASDKLTIHIDLADLRGFQYHTGIIFGCYAASQKLYMIAKGGRYDGIGSDFGEAKPATGFSLDLRSALDLLEEVPTSGRQVIYAPIVADPSLVDTISNLKKTVIVKRYYQLDEVPAGSQYLTHENGQWQPVQK
ncbi:MAG: ATP phosphoribosyltransferase regulatory subunit [Hydrogenovibrio sp.]|nr:ATP phosphoribosyltransferase regulatory subunit [Hydrogenovibrio sp.]